MFENLTNKFEEIFSSLKKAPSLDEKQVDEGLKNIRLALLEADVSLEVVKEFINRVKPKALGQEIVRSTSPGQMVVKIVYDELVSFLGDKTSDIKLNAVPPVPIMLVGLQGSGKTTTTAKLARFLEKNNKKKVMMASLDVYRPAAQEQLRLLGEQNNISTLPVIEGQVPTDICRRAISAANLNGSEVILFDTAGRTQIDFQMMNEIKQIENIINPSETIVHALPACGTGRRIWICSNFGPNCYLARLCQAWDLGFWRVFWHISCSTERISLKYLMHPPTE